MVKVPEIFGSMVFNDQVMRERLPREVYKSLIKTIAVGKAIDPSIADCVANAMKDWAIEKGATHFTHWFQPLTGVSAEKHDAFISPVGNCEVIMEFSGKELIKGESDASSFPSGGIRATFEARGYTMWDPASYAFVKDGSLYIPTAFCSYTGEALDTKTPLLRSMDVVGEQMLRILRLFGDTTSTRVGSTVGAEQEYFLIDREHYKKRKDLIYTGRTLFGAPAPKGQELEDHYFGSLRKRVSEYMHELDETLWILGINAKTKHNEAAPAQHELAPIYASTNLAVDQNVLIMEYMKKIAEKHGLSCLLHEKPFEGVNGSGKHNNWSLGTDTGKNLFKPGKTPAENAQFMLILAAIVRMVDEYADLLRLSVASAGNDHRLGAHEAPPAIVSMFIGDDLEAVVDSIVGGTEHEKAKGGTMDMGVPSLPTFKKDTTDRNRTSPFAFTGNKFEFRMVGASQNVAMPNIVLNTAMASVIKDFADRLEGAENFDLAVNALIKETFTKHRRIIFNGNGYSEEWEREAERRGLPNYRRSVDSFGALTAEKNVRLFTDMGVMSHTELESRQEILFENYSKLINIEALTMIDMAKRDYLPAVSEYVGKLSKSAVDRISLLGNRECAFYEKDVTAKLSELMNKTYAAVNALETAEKKAFSVSDKEKQANEYCYGIVPLMDELRGCVDAMETLTGAEYWPVPTYGELTYYVD
ncbi:MAG: glutamine synthetase III [Clostridia bacterium]|nr:glutamine synthetase III [Clostridia bacterium]